MWRIRWFQPQQYFSTGKQIAIPFFSFSSNSFNDISSLFFVHFICYRWFLTVLYFLIFALTRYIIGWRCCIIGYQLALLMVYLIAFIIHYNYAKLAIFRFKFLSESIVVIHFYLLSIRQTNTKNTDLKTDHFIVILQW
jgi:hypothetical protein